MDPLVYVDGVFTSHNFIDGRAPLLLVGFLRHLTKEKRQYLQNKNLYLRGQRFDEMSLDGLDFLEVFIIRSQTFEGDFGEKGRRMAPLHYGMELSLPVSSELTRLIRFNARFACGSDAEEMSWVLKKFKRIKIYGF